MENCIRMREKNSVPLGECWNRWHSFSAVLLSVAVCGAIVVSYGWQATSLLMGGVVVAVVGLMLLRIHWSMDTLSRHSEGLSESAAQAEEHYIGVLLRIVRSVEARDTYSMGHSERVGRLARGIAEQMGLWVKEVPQWEMPGERPVMGWLPIQKKV